jgi:peptide methionine sulfoxide reductase msrA/msrB
MRTDIRNGVLLAILGFGYAFIAWCRSPEHPRQPLAKGETAMVRVRVFNKQGEFVGPIETPVWNLSDDEWRRRLKPEQFSTLRSSSTERPFCGALLENKQQGVYTCAGCGLPLFSSDTKFHSGTGWPSFFQPIAEGNIVEQTDHSYGAVRTEINCARCGGHLGHVFDDGPRPTGLRFCVNSASLNFTPSDQLASLADPIAEQKVSPVAAASGGRATASCTAVFGGGCFWCTEAAFEQLEGVLDVTSGYAGGSADTADYEAVCTGRTGHAEAIRITYDPAKISYDSLLDVFFDAHDPTQLNRQGADIGTQYRSAIFYADDAQKQIAEATIKRLSDKHEFSDSIVTTLEPLKAFYPAEGYHQNYVVNNPLQPYVCAVATPKAMKIREKYPQLLRKESAHRR